MAIFHCYHFNTTFKIIIIIAKVEAAVNIIKKFSIFCFYYALISINSCFSCYNNSSYDFKIKLLELFVSYLDISYNCYDSIYDISFKFSLTLLISLY